MVAGNMRPGIGWGGRYGSAGRRGVVTTGFGRGFGADGTLGAARQRIAPAAAFSREPIVHRRTVSVPVVLQGAGGIGGRGESSDNAIIT